MDQRIGVTVDGDIEALRRSLRSVIVPIMAVRDGNTFGFGTGILIGGAQKGFMWGVTATHVFTHGVIPALRRREAHRSALKEFLPDDWDSPLAHINDESLRVEYDLEGQLHSCPIVAVGPWPYDNNCDLVLFVMRLPPGIAANSLHVSALNINSDDIPFGRPVITAGFLWKEGDGSGPYELCLGAGVKIESTYPDQRTGAQTYQLTAASDHGMSGGAVLVADQRGHLTRGVSAIISGGFEGDPQTKAVSLAALYAFEWRSEAHTAGVSSFVDLLRSGRVLDCGEDRHLIEVIVDGQGKRVRRYSRILMDHGILLVPRSYNK